MKKAADFLERIQCIFSMILFMVFLACIVIQILTRYVPFIKITWTEEISVYAFIWAILMGTAVMLKRNEHFAFDFFRSKVTGVGKLVTETFIYLVMFGFSCYVAYCGVQLTRQFWNWTLTSLTWVSQRYTWSSLIVCGLTMAFYSLSNITEVWGNFKNIPTKDLEYGEERRDEI
ncbi:MAG: TRAP transporter small permease [Lachnospiraceae bacterium]|jgi:TRAP-type C4-dicarboxylate transport system permease small subunit|nr:TRAP transporter small permease [Lachnospiraceae bacterium]